MNQYADPQKLKKLKTKANSLPMQPGVYIMKNKNDEIIYIGKAKALKNRVTQYFGLGNQHTEKVRKMVSNVCDFEYIICDSEFEALILENSLIKQNQPKYNILLKDDKGYNYVKFTDEKWQRIEVAKKLDKNGEYFGPYNSANIIKETVDEVRKIFKLPDCNRDFERISKPCLNFHIGICDAPCNHKISYSDYLENIQAAKEFIKNGDINDVSIDALTEKMNLAAENLQFELAAKLRDRINAIKKIREKQKVVSTTYNSQDVIATVFLGELACVEVITFRNYKLCDKVHFFLDGFSKRTSLYYEFLQQYYSNKKDIPSRILIDIDDDFSATEEWLSDRAKKRVTILSPKHGEQKRILDMCLNNAAQNLAERTERSGRNLSALNELATLLGLDSIPDYIEAYDISNTSGSYNVASMVVFKGGKPYKKAYKRFKIDGFIGQDDYRSMSEVLDRRFSEYLKGEDEGFSKLPDLILLDGAKGQISAVLPILEKYNIKVEVYGMVKDSKHRTRAIATTGGDIAIKSNRKAFTLITNIQDEAHRFAISYHKLLQSKNMIKSELLEIEGVGQKRAAILMRHFGSIKKIKNACFEDLLQVDGITEKTAKSVYRYFNEL